MYLCHVGGAAAVRAVDHDDVVCGKGDAFVSCRDGRVIPFGNASQENSGQRFRCKVQRAADTRNIVGGNYRTENGRKMQNSCTILGLKRFQLVVVHRPVRCSEIDGTVGGLLDTRTGTHRLIVDLGPVGFMKFVKPFGINGSRESRARSIDQQRALGPDDSAKSQKDYEHSCKSLH